MPLKVFSIPDFRRQSSPIFAYFFIEYFNIDVIFLYPDIDVGMGL